MMPLPLSPWLLSRSAGQPRVRLFCFPYAGGSPAMFMRWCPLLPDGVEVCAIQQPGKGSRIAEDPWHDIFALIEALAEEIRPRLDLPAIFFGHSLGAILAFEIARRSAGIPNLKHLIVSGCRAPIYWPPERGLRLASLTGQSFIEALREYDGTPAEILDNEEILEFLLPVIKADFDLVASYRYAEARPLDIPITIFASEGDRQVPVETLAAWQAECRREIATHFFDGDHFYIDHQRQAVLAAVRSIVEAHAGHELSPSA